MNKFSLRLVQKINKESEVLILSQFLPEINEICSNKIRAGILYLLISCPETMHSMRVEDLCFRLGVRPTICIYHLEKLKECNLVEVKKNQKYGRKTRRSIWGLNLKYPSWIQECYKMTRSYFFSEKELFKLINVNKSFR